MSRLLPALLLLAACASKDGVELTPTTTAPEAVDHTVSDADLGELGPDDVVLSGAEFVVEPGRDVMVCQFGTWTGPDVGMSNVHTFQGKYGHHFQIMGTSTPALDVADGTVVDCTGEGGGFDMASLEPLGVPNVGTVDGELIDLSLPLPEGMAVELESGQRYVLQSHYLNTSADPIRVSDKVVVHTVPPDQVETWAATLVFNRDDFAIPAGGTLETSFDCEVDGEWDVLYLLGHMHEWGTAFNVEKHVGDALESVYSVPEWDPVFRDAPVVQSHVGAPLHLSPGDTFRTTCAWANDTEAEITFPHEMCATVALVYPQKTTTICDGNGQ